MPGPGAHCDQAAGKARRRRIRSRWPGRHKAPRCRAGFAGRQPRGHHCPGSPARDPRDAGGEPAGVRADAPRDLGAPGTRRCGAAGAALGNIQGAARPMASPRGLFSPEATTVTFGRVTALARAETGTRHGAMTATAAAKTALDGRISFSSLNACRLCPRSPRRAYVVVRPEQVARVEFPLETGQAPVQRVAVGGLNRVDAVTGGAGEEVDVAAVL